MTSAGIVNDSNRTLSLKAPGPIDVTVLDRSTEVNLVHWLKTPAPIDDIPFGILIDSKPEFANAYSEIVVSESGSSADFSDLQ